MINLYNNHDELVTVKAVTVKSVTKLYSNNDEPVIVIKPYSNNDEPVTVCDNAIQQ